MVAILVPGPDALPLSWMMIVLKLCLALACATNANNSLEFSVSGLIAIMIKTPCCKF